MRRNKSGFVYLLMDHTFEYVKIGLTSNTIEERVNSMIVGTPHEIYIINYISVDADKLSKLERQLHIKFNHLHHRGEWFRFDYSIIQEFERIQNEVKPFQPPLTYVEQFFFNFYKKNTNYNVVDVTTPESYYYDYMYKHLDYR